MRKLSLIFSLLFATGLFTQKAFAQTPTLESGVWLYIDGGITVSELNLTIQSQQVLSATEDPSWQNPLSQAINNIPTTSTTLLLGPVYYWQTPSIFSTLNFTFPGSNYVYLQNNTADKRIYYVQLSYTNESGQTTYINGPNSATISSLGWTYVYFPSPGEASWNNASYFPVNPTYGVPTPVLIAVHGN